MKTLVLLALVGLAIGFPAPTFAQEQKAVDPKVRQQIEAVFQKFQEAYNKHDVAAIAALHTQDAVEVRSWQGLASGREVIGKRFAFDFAGGFGKMVNELAQVYALGNDICAISNTTVGTSKGHAVTIYVREGDDWKIRMAYVNHSAQEKNSVDPQVRQQIESVEMQFQEAFNKYDAAAIAALYTQDGGEILTWWPSVVALASGRPAIEKRFAATFAQRPVEMANKLVEVSLIGNDVCATTDMSAGAWKHGVKIYVRDGNTWKIRIAYVNPL
jgi:ketosteroid isomerase-like protein